MDASASSTVYGVGKVTTASTSLNVRKSASTSSTIIGSVKRNSLITLISKNGNFWYIRYGTSSYGYCSADYITVSSKDVKTVKTTSGNLNVRNSASTNSTILTRLPSGTKVPVISTSNGWSKILYNGTKTGFVSSTYLSTNSASTNYSKIAFSIPPKIPLSKGLIINCLASGIEILASCFNGVGAP